MTTFTRRVRPEEAMATARAKGLRFVKTSTRVWQGNGFDDAPAEWVALVGDVEVGRFDWRYAEVYGRSNLHFGSGSPRWKRDVAYAVNADPEFPVHTRSEA